MVSSADMAREIMTTHDIIFANRTRTTAAEIFLNGCVGIALAPYGNHWRQARKICSVGFLSLTRVQSFQYAREEEIESLINNLCRLSREGGSVNLREMLLDVTNNVIARVVLGQKRQEKEGKIRFGELSRKMAVQFTSFTFGDYFPSWRWLDEFTGLVSELKKTSKEMDSYLDKVIEEHKILRKDDDQCDKKDFVDILLQLQEDGSLEMELTRDEIKAIILVS